jgi:protein-disulfide isomerase
LTLKDLKSKYGKDVRLVYKHYVVHPQIATTPALAACAAGKQGKFWEFYDAVFDSAWDLSSGSPRLIGADKLNADHMLDLAASLSLDIDRFRADMNGDACKADVANDQTLLASVGVRGTPSFFINGRFLSGAQPMGNFEALIDEEKTKAEAAIKAGQRRSRYYDEVVVKKGKTTVD